MPMISLTCGDIPSESSPFFAEPRDLPSLRSGFASSTPTIPDKRENKLAPSAAADELLRVKREVRYVRRDRPAPPIANSGWTPWFARSDVTRAAHSHGRGAPIQ